MQEIEGNNSDGLMLVGIGASAGGVDALLRFFEQTPADGGLAFAVVLHTSPDYESHLAEVLQTKTEMPVIQVSETVRVERNRVYCIPPGKGISMSGSHIRLDDTNMVDARNAPIDIFFRALASAYKEKAIAVVLSGTGADGSLGLGRVREEGGVSIAQDPSEAKHRQMPESAIGTGYVDFVMPVAYIPAKLVTLRQNAERIQLPAAEIPISTFEETTLRELLALLRAHTRHDFSGYKRATLLRRIERRLQVTESEDLPAYIEYVRRHPEELQGLLRDLLISVTNFFRDREAFSKLEHEVMPQLFEGRAAGDQIRVWVAGCATGEEAYSITMLLMEYADTLTSPPTIQVFATDIDEDALALGRTGVYPHTIAADVSAERLKRFFLMDGHYYRVRRELREAVLFAPHNILRDPPFSRLSMVSCRNLLIYINRNMQERILEIFHFALKPEGYLFLGSSESADGLSGLFTPLDKKYRIFKRYDDGNGLKPPPQPPVHGAWIPHPSALSQSPQTRGRAEGFSYGEIHYRMLEELAPPSVLINGDYDIVHLSEGAGRFLRMAGGEPTRNLLKVVNPGLQPELRALLLSASHDGATRKVQVKLDGSQSYVIMSVRRLEAPHMTPGLMLVFFEEQQHEPEIASEAGAVPVSAAGDSESHIAPVIQQLDEELQRTRDRLRASVEEYETSIEELKASNEELQAMNEELRSASEELETSKEESQAVNEELTALNMELREKVEEITRANSDLQNLLVSTRIATIFLDRSLRIRRYTPSAQELFNIIPGDLGRPLAHVTNRLSYAGLVEDSGRVLAELVTVEREVETTDGRWLTARLMPYRDINDRINGVVLTFTDIHERKEAEEKLRASEERLRLVVETAEGYAIMLLDSEGRYTDWNTGAEKIFGFTREEALGQTTEIIFTPEDRSSGAHLQELRIADREGFARDERWHVRKDGLRNYCSGVMVALRLGRGYAKIARDLTSEKQAQEKLQQGWNELDEHVQKRTAELAEANSALKAEIESRRRIEQERTELLRRIVSTQEGERRRIARELHDQLGQSLTVLKLRLEGLSEETGKRSRLRSMITELVDIAKRLDTDVDFLAWELRPTALDDLGLIVALSNYAKEWMNHFDIKVDFHSTGLGDERLAPLVETNLYRITQEALNNISKHAGATSVGLLLERRDREVVLIVEDDGRGFDPERVEASGDERGMGLIGMRERAALLGGTVEIESAPGKGTAIFVRVPAKSDSLDAVESGEVTP